MKFKHLFLMLTMLMSMSVCNMTLVSCSDDDPVGGKGEQPTEDPEKNTTDVAVTGPVLDYGALYADIKGVVNLNAISASYSKVGFGICISETPDMDDGDDFWAENLVGRTIEAHFLLYPSTTYYYATFVNVPTLSYVYWGKTYSFTTKPINKDAAVTGSVSDIGTFSAKISGTTNPKEVYAAGAEAFASVELSEDADFKESFEVEANDDIEKFNVEVKSLAPNTKYYYRTCLTAHSQNEEWVVIEGSTQSFTTKPINEDAVVTGDATNIGLFNATLGGSTKLKQFDDAGIKTSVGVEVSANEDFSNARKISVTGNVDKFNVEVTSLSYGTKYYYRSYLKYNLDSQEKYYYGGKKSFTTKGLDNSNHYVVDLGLPSGTLWATMNIGAISPEDYGDYFAWGETKGYNSGKIDFNWSTYKWCKGFTNTMTKYCTEFYYGYNGFTDNKTELDPEDDAAYVLWDPAWRMPSLKQFEELINSSYTTTKWTTVNGVYGRKITSLSNGNSIFLPAAGYRYDTSLYDAGSNGYYLSRTLYSGITYDARGLGFNSSGVNMGNLSRVAGQSVRPVCSPE